MNDQITPPTPERLKKPDIGVMAGDRGGREIRSFAHPLDFYLKRDWITRPQRDAGNRYGELWEVGYGRSRYAQSRYGDPLTRGKHEAGRSDDCRDAFDRAADAIRDIPARALAFHVCCLGYKAGPGRIVELRDALDTLDTHFYRRSTMR